MMSDKFKEAMLENKLLCLLTTCDKDGLSFEAALDAAKKEYEKMRRHKGEKRVA